MLQVLHGDDFSFPGWVPGCAPSRPTPLEITVLSGSSFFFYDSSSSSPLTLHTQTRTLTPGTPFGKIKTAELDIFLMGNFDILEKSREICTRDSRS